MENNRRLHQMLVDRVDVAYQNREGRTVYDKVRLIDFEEPEANDWLVANQFTVIENGHIVGSLTENLLLRHLASGESLTATVVNDLQGPPFSELPSDAPAQEAYTIFSTGQSAVAVMNGETLEGIVTKSDLLEFWAHTRNG